MSTEQEKESMTVLSQDEISGKPDAGGSEHFDMEALLRPISPDRPAGEDLRYDGTYDKIKEARRSDDPSLPQGVWERGLKKADWKEVQEICTQSLALRTKDIQIAVWLLEALMEKKGFAGLRDGLKLLIGLCERFWENIYPQMDEDGPDARVSPFVWMNESLSIRMKMIRITQPESSMDAVSLCFSDWEESEDLDKLANRDKRQYDEEIAKGRITRARFLGSVMFSSKSFYETQSACLNESVSLLDTLSQFLDKKCGKMSPGFGKFRDILLRIQGLTRNFLQEKQKNNGEEENSMESDIREKGETGSAETGGSASSISIRNRSDAYKMLSAAADYLLIHEPHSPTPYLVKRAVSWGHMTLTELLHELIMDEHDLNQIFKLLGLKGPVS